MKFVLAISIVFHTVIFAQETCPPPVFDTNVFTNIFQNSFIASATARLGQIECVDLAINESREINLNRNNSPSGMTHHYALRRTGESSYESSINIVFKPEVDAQPVISSEDISSMNTRVASCLEEMSPYLLGPNGESLTIKIDTSAPASYIRLARGPIRANSGRYPIDIDCSTILHEVLHLHGLADEYNESQTSLVFNEERNIAEYIDDNNGNAYNCRHVGPSDSVMSNQRNTLRNLQVANASESGTCVRGTAGSIQNISSERSKECPKGFYLNTANTEGKGGGRISLLEPAHFNAIINPGCSKNNLYYLCSLNAYQSSLAYTQNGSTGCSHVGGIDMNASSEDNTRSCLPTPDLCNDPSAWLSGRAL